MLWNSFKSPPITYFMRTAVVLFAAAALSMASQASRAQEAAHPQETPPLNVAETQTAATTDSSGTPDGASSLQEVIVTGTRQSGLEAVQSAAPIQIVGSAQLQQTAAIPNLMNVLAQAVPSFQAQLTGTDMAGLTLQAKLDGLSPNEVLVLVNGKRRNTTANLSVVSSAYQGGAGVDLSLLPLDAIDHIEVLQDGASAQYGSDAIAGVINIILKKNDSGGYVTATDGGYFDGGGRTGQVSANFGFAPLDDSFLNVSGEIINKGHSQRQFPDLRTLVTLSPSSNDACCYPNSNLTQVPGAPNIDYGMGDGEQHLQLVTANGGYDFDGGIELYTTTTYAGKQANTFEGYRLPNKVHYVDANGNTVYAFPYGFDPKESIDEIDYQQTTGLRGTWDDWRWDLSSGYGGDRIDVATLGSSNATLVSNGVEPPLFQNFDDGTLTTTQWVSTLDLDRDFQVGLAGPLNVAVGAEYRRETYSISAGSPQSYELGGAQSFPGWEPTDAGRHSRKNYSGYVDLAVKPIDALRLDAAGRYEHYSDFGSATIGRLTARYDFNPVFALRGTINNGFRAPTLPEEYYSSTNVAPTSAFVQLPPNSAAGKILGLGSGLQAEKSINYSFGAVFRPLPNLAMTLDIYQITITNRIVGSGSLYSNVNGQSVNPLILSAIQANGNQLDPDVLATGTVGAEVFTNGLDTRTRGAQFTLDYPVHYALGRVDYNVGFSYNNTEVTAIYPNPAPLGSVPLFNVTALGTLTDLNPRWVANVGATWNWDRLTLNVLEKIYGPNSSWTSDSGDNSTNTIEYFKSEQGVTPLTDVTLTMQISKHISVTAGAENALNRYPDLENSTLIAHTTNPIYVAKNGASGTSLWGPAIFGNDGGYYFVTGRYTF